jgi:hypothetical protein
MMLPTTPQRRTLAFSCGARMNSSLVGKELLKKHAIARQLQGFVMRRRSMEHTAADILLARKQKQKDDHANSAGNRLPTR